MALSNLYKYLFVVVLGICVNLCFSQPSYSLNFYPQQMVPSPSVNKGDLFGTCVATTGNYLFVSAPQNFPPSVYIYTCNAQSCSPANGVSVLTFPHAVSNTSFLSFGYSMAAQGDMLVVGAPDLSATTSGRAYVYTLSPSSQDWTLVANLTQGGTGISPNYGKAVGVSSTAIVVWTSAGAFSSLNFYNCSTFNVTIRITGIQKITNPVISMTTNRVYLTGGTNIHSVAYNGSTWNQRTAFTSNLEVVSIKAINDSEDTIFCAYKTLSRVDSMTYNASNATAPWNKTFSITALTSLYFPLNTGPQTSITTSTFGASLATFGNTASGIFLIVGDPESTSPWYTGTAAAGAVWIYSIDFTNFNATLVSVLFMRTAEYANLATPPPFTYFGLSVATSDNWLAIGVPGDNIKSSTGYYNQSSIYLWSSGCSQSTPTACYSSNSTDQLTSSCNLQTCCSISTYNLSPYSASYCAPTTTVTGQCSVQNVACATQSGSPPSTTGSSPSTSGSPPSTSGSPPSTSGSSTPGSPSSSTPSSSSPSSNTPSSVSPSSSNPIDNMPSSSDMNTSPSPSGSSPSPAQASPNTGTIIVSGWVVALFMLAIMKAVS